MGVVARFWVNNDNSAGIRLYNTELWETTDWSSGVVNFDLPPAPFNPSPMFTMAQSGVGALSDSGKTLEIRIPVCPIGSFLLTIGTFQKTFTIDSTLPKLSSVVIAVNEKSILTNDGILNAYSYPKSDFLMWMSNSFENQPKGGITRGRLLDADRNVVAIALGSYYHNIRGTVSGTFWPFGGIIFTRFIWNIEPPLVETEYTLSFVPQLRTGTQGKVESQVFLSSTQLFGPKSTVFNADEKGMTMQLEGGFI